MSKVGSDISHIQSEIAKLPPDKVRKVARWLEEYESELWDRGIKKDSRAGGPLD